MLRLVGVLFIAVLAQFVVHGWRLFVMSMADGEMDRWENGHNEIILKDFPGE